MEVEIPMGHTRRKIVVSLPDFKDNIKDSYFGSVVGRVAGRISRGTAIIEGKRYYFEKNDGENTGHSGRRNFSNRIWKVKYLKENEICFTLESPNGENGFPGNLIVQVKYTLFNNGEILITTKGKTDKTTLFNPTSHIYFNLNGSGNQSVADHTLSIESEKVVLLNEDNSPRESATVEGKIFDMRQGKKLFSILSSKDPQILINQGLNHPFLLKKDKQPQLVLSSGDQKIKMKMATTQESVVVYTTGKYQEGYKTNIGQLCFAGGIALETQKPPGFEKIRRKNTFLIPGENFESRTRFSFIVNL